MEEEILEHFIEWARENSPDAWFIYDEPEKAIKQFLEEYNKK